MSRATGDEATLAFYQREAPSYTASSAQRQSRHLDAFLDRLKPGARILELGCGGGRDAAHMVERGFSVDPTDATPAMVRKAQERWNLPARVMRFDELNAKEEYEAVWAHASLLHCPREELCGVLERIYAALKPCGWHFANYKLGEREGRDNLGRYYNFPDPAWLELEYVSAGGWQSIAFEEEAGGGYDGVVHQWLCLTARKENR